MLRLLPRGTGLLIAASCLPHVVHAQGAAPAASDMQEVLVSAQKRTEHLQDVPVPVSVIKADALAENNQVLIKDYYSSIPGLSLSPDITGYQMLSIRGVTTGGLQSPTVGILVDDVPFGGSLSTNDGEVIPDIDPGDLERVEVLRGPQGTLYGADSMGGLFKFVTKEPSSEAFGARFEAGTSNVRNGAEPGFTFRGSANIPLDESAAIRVSGFRRQDPGYIDNVQTGQRGVNGAEAEGARIGTLWRPMDSFTVKLSALYQNIKGNGVAEVDKLPGLGDLQQSYIPHTGSYDSGTQAYSANLDYKLGDAELTSVTGYNVQRFHSTVDFTNLFSGLVGLFYPGAGSPFETRYLTRKFSQELRLLTPLGSHFDLLLGGFYTRENGPEAVIIGAENLTTGQSLPAVGYLDIPTTYYEYAGFVDLTFKITNQFDIQVGGRESRFSNQNDTETDSGPAYGAAPQIAPPVKSTGSPFTYLVTPRFKFSPDLMIYARLASGYRPGGANTAAVHAQGAPADYSPDKTHNYEIGAKGNFFDHLLSAELSVYHIDWKNIQLNLVLPTGYAYKSNGSGAKSEGVELSASLRATAGLTVGGWVTYDNALLTKPLGPDSPVAGSDGDRLANTPHFSGNLSAQQDFPLTQSMTGFSGAALSYIGDREGVFVASGTSRQSYASYAKFDLRAGVRYNSWTVNMYANNVTDKRGVLNGGTGYTVPFAFIYIQPRTVGLSVVNNF